MFNVKRTRKKWFFALKIHNMKSSKIFVLFAIFSSIKYVRMDIFPNLNLMGTFSSLYLVRYSLCLYLILIGRIQLILFYLIIFFLNFQIHVRDEILSSQLHFLYWYPRPGKTFFSYRKKKIFFFFGVIVVIQKI